MLHEAHAGLGVAGEDRPLDRRRAAPARQQREVQVHEPERERLQQRDRQQLPERDDDAELGAARRTSSTISRALSGVRTGKPSSTAARLTGDGSVPGAARPAAIGLRDDERDVVAGFDERAQRRDRVGRRAEVDDAHGADVLRRHRACVRPPGVGTPIPCSRSSRIARLRCVALEAVEHEHAVEVVDLVQEHPAEQLVALRSRPRCRRGRGPAWSRASGRTISNARPGQRQAAFFVLPLAASLDDLRD